MTAKRVDVGDPRNGSQRRADHPIEQTSPLGQREIGTVDREHEHFTERARNRGESTGHALRKIARDIG